MGCINSKKKLTELRSENVFRVRVVQLPAARNGFLELNPRELIFCAQGHGQQSSVVWALQHLRRYGLNGDIFSFEAGRRCMTGPGIYTFRCQHAERLYQLFQRYVNAVSLSVSDDVFARDRDHPSHTLGRADLANSHTNNYLEPAPLTGGGGMVGTAAVRSIMHESFSSSPLSLELDSPDSVPSVSFTNEVVHFQSHSGTGRGAAYVNTSSNVGSSSNVYLEHPLRSHLERNNNNNTVGVSGNGSAFNTLTRKAVMKRSSLDAPPEECAPMLTPPSTASDALHMYANVETLGTGTGSSTGNCQRERDREKNLDPSERCYENLARLDLPLLMQSAATTSTASYQLERAMSRELQQPGTPGAGSAVNYIVLDLDQPRSPAQCSPKTCFGSGLSLATERVEDQSHSSDVTTTTPTATTKQKETIQLQQQQKNESTLGYSTIDFIKTCALIKSSTHGADLDPTDHEELRITRHSKCVRKAYSISE